VPPPKNTNLPGMIGYTTYCIMIQWYNKVFCS
jgi:hypothetical protein